MEFSLTQLRTLRELQRLGTMAAVADSLGYTHGAISQQLANLERTAGFKLIAKHGRRVMLTDAGAILAEYADRILLTVQDAEDALHSTLDIAAGPVRLGTFTTAAATLLAAAIELAQQRFPTLTITSREVTVDDATAAVRRGEVDAAFGLDYPNSPIPREENIEHVRLRSERFSLAIPTALTEQRRASGLADSPIHLSEAAEWDWILPPPESNYGRAVRVACRLAGFEPRVVHEVTDTAASLALVGRGLGITPVTEMMQQLMVSGSFDVVALHEEITREVILALRSENRGRPSVEALAAVLDEVVRQFTEGEADSQRN